MPGPTGRKPGRPSRWDDDWTDFQRPNKERGERNAAYTERPTWCKKRDNRTSPWVVEGLIKSSEIMLARLVWREFAAAWEAKEYHDALKREFGDKYFGFCYICPRGSLKKQMQLCEERLRDHVRQVTTDVSAAYRDRGGDARRHARA